MSILLRIGAVRGSAYNVDHLSAGQDAASSDTDAHDIPVPEETYQRPTQTYPGCFGLPYQDHNYGAPPPLSPSPPKTPPPPPPKVNGAVQLEEEAKVPAVSNEEEVVEDSVTRCICGFLHDDGYMICCDKCSVWQHIDCMEIDRNNIPENYCCEVCEPRKLDVDRARMIQLRKREEIASLGRKPVQPKPKGSKQRRVSKAGSRLLKTGKLTKSQQLKRDKKLKLTKKEKENVKDLSKKQKIGKTGIPKQKKLKKKLNTSLAQNKADFWTSVSGPFCSVDEVRENEYSPEILDFLSHVKTNGIHSPHSIGVFPEELLVRLYQVSDVKKNRKGLEATDLIVPGRAVIEFKGKVMLRQHCHNDPLLNQSQPYVLYYSKFEGLDLCIDASAFGGDARFIRRSCTPNAEMCHIIDNGNLHFIVQAKKEIAKGSEITIPFDFNYQDSTTCVECACGKANCPVTKFWKKVKLAQKSPDKPKRKRQASGEGRVRRNSQSKGSPAKSSSGSKSPVKSSPLKSPASVTPLSFTMDECSVSVDSTASFDGLPSVSQPAKTSSISRRSSRAASDTKEEREVKPCRTSQSKEPCTKSATVQEDIHVVDVQSSDSTALNPASESEAESAGECPKKMTREERKMEAIMKAFEKMAKREERRKEALARLDKKHHDVKDEPCDKIQPAETNSGNSSETATGDRVVEQPAPPEVTIPHPETETKITIKLEDPPAIVESPQKTARSKRMKRKRRSSRVMSALEPLYSSPVKMNPDLLAPLVGGVEVKEEPMEPPPVICHSAPSTASPELDASNPDLCDSYMFIKKKKYLVNDWGGARAADARSDSMDEHGEEETFVPYTPGPRSAMEHMQRRNSTSATFGRSQDAAGGNAKKRWLRQAMHERGPIRVDTSPSPTGSTPLIHSNTPVPTATPTATATTPSLPSPTSPSDFVTPLKKRRLAPEFLPSTSSAADSNAPGSCEPSATVNSNCEVSGTYPTTSTPASAVGTMPASLDRSQQVKAVEETRLPMKATRLFGKRNRNGLVGSTDTKPAHCDGPVPGSSSVSAARPSVEVPPSDSRLEELSMDGLSSSSSLRTASSSATVRSSVDSAEVSECSSDSPGVAASSSSVMCVVNNNDSGVDMPLVDSSGAALDVDLPEAGQQRVRGSDSVSVCSSDNEVSVSVHSADSDQRSDRGSAQDIGVVAESSSVSNAVGMSSPQDQDQDVSESRPAEDRMEMEDEGNEASGSVSGSEEPVGASGSRSHTVSQPAGDCQVNSSQDSPWIVRLPPPACSPSLREAECNNSPESLPPIHRTCDSWQVSPGSGERGAVSSAQDSGVGDRDRNGVSSAQDIADVSSVLAMRDSDSLASSDLECGPSSSTQTLGSRHFVSEDMICNSSSTHSPHGRGAQVEDTVCNSSSAGSLPGGPAEVAEEDMVCNSSDVTGSDVVPRLCEESNVDSTTQSGQVLRPSPNQCDTADSCQQPAESEESCCDSNSDEQAYPDFVTEGASVSSSGPADSQCDQMPDTGQRRAGPSNGMVSSSATVSSSQFSASHTDSCLSSIAATASSSALSTTDPADLAGPSQYTPGTSPNISNSSSGLDGGSLDPSAQLVTSAGAAAMVEEGRETDSVGTSEQSSSSTSLAAEPCEASASLAHRWRLSDDAEPSLQPVTSGMLQSQEAGEVSVSSAIAGDGQEDRVVVNGDVTPGGLVSSYSEDSSGSNTTTSSCTTVSSSEAQAAPAAKRKVSLSEYRNRRKEKGGCAASTSSSTSPKSSANNLMESRRATVDSSVSLAPLPLFEPITINRESRDLKEQERERREKPMSLSDRLRIEFGLETASEEEKVNSSGHRRSTNDIPPPPPLPPNGVMGVVGARRALSTGARAENDDESRQGAGSSAMGRSPSATTTTLGSGANAAFPSSGSTVNHTLGSQPAGGQSALQPGYTWLAKLHSGRPTSTALPHQQPPPPPPPATSSVMFGQHQAQPPPFNGPGAGVPPHLPNGSHPQPPAPAAFSPGAMYPSPPPGQPSQPFTATPPPPAKQQQAPPPPPPPSTAYPTFVAQSRTHASHHPQTSPQQIPRVRSGSLSQAQHSGSAVGNGSGRVRHASADPSSHHPPRRHHFDQYSHSQTAKHKGSFGSAVKRH